MHDVFTAWTVTAMPDILEQRGVSIYAPRPAAGGGYFVHDAKYS